MLPAAYRVNRIQKTLRWFEGDIPLLDLRVRDLSPERQQSAREFAAMLIDQTRAELQRLLASSPLSRQIQPNILASLPTERIAGVKLPQSRLNSSDRRSSSGFNTVCGGGSPWCEGQGDFFPETLVAEDARDQGSVHGVAGPIRDDLPQDRLAQ